ncbi:MAG: outer membrane lipoprotein carrier protein LolA [Acetobacteraceae bacterium]|nr:outer membrane lipoprotein carrier protein LolA [Acetobacteraceae bacterium]
MHRRAVLLAALALPVSAWAQSASLSAQDRADIARVESYLNSIRTLHARFLQIAPDGSTSEGQAWLQRPGRMRFQYDPPSPFLLVGGHGLLVFNDSQLQQTSNIPLAQTPLGILLQDNLRLSGALTVSNVTRLPGQLQVTLHRTASPQDGSLTLIFADNPLTLRSWITTDAQRHETRVTLYDVKLGGTFNQSLFEFVDPRFFRNNGGGNGSG